MTDNKVTFKEFLDERVNIDYIKILNDSLEQIKQKCSKYLADSAGNILYKGFKSPSINKNSITLLNHPKFEKAISSGSSGDLLFNSVINAAFNIVDIRSKSIYATHNYDLAETLGDVFFFLPCGDYKFIWSPDVSDSKSVPTLLTSEISSKLKSVSSNDITNLFLTVSGLYGNSSDWVCNKHMASIMLDEIKERYNKFHELKYDDLFNALKSVGREEYKDSSLTDAIKSNNEILFYKTSGYYLIPISFLYNAAQIEGVKIYGYKDAYNYLYEKIK